MAVLNNFSIAKIGSVVRSPTEQRMHMYTYVRVSGDMCAHAILAGELTVSVWSVMQHQAAVYQSSGLPLMWDFLDMCIVVLNVLLSVPEV